MIIDLPEGTAFNISKNLLDFWNSGIMKGSGNYSKQYRTLNMVLHNIPCQMFFYQMNLTLKSVYTEYNRKWPVFKMDY